MDYTKKILYQSNYWYNDGLRKAQITGHVRCGYLIFGGVYSIIGRILPPEIFWALYTMAAEKWQKALVEWIISKNLKPRDNVADYFISEVQESASELEIDQPGREALQSVSCVLQPEWRGSGNHPAEEGGCVSSHIFEGLSAAWRSYTCDTEQYAKARQILRIARKLDTTNDMTLRYMHEMANLRGKKVKDGKKGKEETVEYSLGNETIIQPRHAGLKVLAR